MSNLKSILEVINFTVIKHYCDECACIKYVGGKSAICELLFELCLLLWLNTRAFNLNNQMKGQKTQVT